MNSKEPKCLPQIAEGTPYPLDAFQFVRRGLDFTVLRIHADPRQLAEDQRHVSGRQLSDGLRGFAVEQYGYMARTVLQRWNITRTEDFGQIVFAMVEGGLMRATAADTVRDFDGVFSFDDAFDVSVDMDSIPPGSEVSSLKSQV